jgi:hypothetical protein
MSQLSVCAQVWCSDLPQLDLEREDEAGRLRFPLVMYVTVFATVCKWLQPVATVYNAIDT